jgi:hypothetical protein
MASFDMTTYGQKRSALGSQYGAKAAQNAYAQFLSQQRGARKKFDLEQQQGRQTPRVVSSFTKRGLAGPGISSGVFAQGMTDFATKSLNDMNDLNLQNASELRNLEQQSVTDLADYESALADLEFTKNQNIANTAATLTAFKPFLGA